ncbi:MAG: glycoside hydrolase family 130 protein [Phycisphaerales bacterium]|nr:MAG: glycoside hydrolase family 130 protein [Phycisphaerales bacterium]
MTVRRLPVRLSADASLTITRLFWAGPDRARKVIARIAELEDVGVSQLLAATRDKFAHLHLNLEDIFLSHYQQVARRLQMTNNVSSERKLLIGAYFTLEYAFASAALFNPSMTPAIDQTGLEPGALRFSMSLRAVGEGHLSSIIFRRGIIDAAGNITLETAGPYHEPTRMAEHDEFRRAKFRARRAISGVRDEVIDGVLSELDDSFSLQDVLRIVDRVQARAQSAPHSDHEPHGVEWLTTCDYDVETSPEGNITELVLFPISEAESQGMEDMRLVRFTEDDGSQCYYGTYTAYNGRQVLPHLAEMPRPGLARIRMLHGRYAKNKGLALFPRRVQGQYMMSGRIDGENLYILKSPNVRVWDHAVLVQEPQFPWEFMQIGNCGSPIETEAGWLLLTHGVGPMRHYCIGAMLLDRDDPTKLIGRLAEPLLMPTGDERNGYVPNVVYSCGALVHSGLLVIPYGISDAATGFATVPLDDVLARLA